MPRKLSTVHIFSLINTVLLEIVLAVLRAPATAQLFSAYTGQHLDTIACCRCLCNTRVPVPLGTPVRGTTAPSSVCCVCAFSLLVALARHQERLLMQNSQFCCRKMGFRALPRLLIHTPVVSSRSRSCQVCAVSSLAQPTLERPLDTVRPLFSSRAKIAEACPPWLRQSRSRSGDCTACIVLQT